MNQPITISELRCAANQITKWLEWEVESLNAFHAYAQRFHKGRAGSNVYMLVLGDALRQRGMTVEQFMEAESL